MILIGLAIGSGIVWATTKFLADEEKTAEAKAALTKFKDEHLAPIALNESTLQILGFSNLNDESETSEFEKEVNRNLTVSLVSLGLATAGGLLYPPLIILSIPGLVYTALPIFEEATEAAKEGKVGVALVDFLSIGGTLLAGYYSAAALASSLFYFSQKILLTTQDNSRKSLINIFESQPRVVYVLRDGAEVETEFETLEVGDIVVVDPGQTIPIDGVITHGIGLIDQRALTGESQPVEKEVGDEVFTATVLLSGSLHVRVERAGVDTVAAQISDILNSTADFQSTIQSRGQKIVDQGALPTLALSGLALPLLGGQSALAVLFSSFGFHMKIAAPFSVINFLRITSENGILVKDGRALELLSQIDTVVFDKTGTLTEDVPTVGAIYTDAGYNENELLALAAAAEYKQTHPIARAITKEAHKRDLILPHIDDLHYEVGYGLKIKAGETVVCVGSSRFIEMEGVALETGHKEREKGSYEAGHSLVYLAIDDQLAGAIELIPTIRPESFKLVKELHRRNISTVIISGDHQKPTQLLAESLGIDQYFAEVLPQDKAELIEQLQNEGKSICFIGDGINDSIALKTAQVGVSMRGASTIATDTAGIVLMDGTLNQFIYLLDIANELDTNLTRSTIMTIAPGVICVGGIFFLNFGLVSAIMIFNASLAAAVFNSMLPLLNYQQDKADSSKAAPVVINQIEATSKVRPLEGTS
ncbi:MAG: heavy metal translocating P-type ATPase [Chloroflexota bacterium]